MFTLPDEISAREKGSMLEDMVADYFNFSGFDVQKRIRMKDQFSVEHEIDVFATKKEDFGTYSVAVECKYVFTPIEIKEVRNFNDKLESLGINKGMFVSTGGFTNDAENYAKSRKIELWDLATLQDKISKVASKTNILNDVLPIDRQIRQVLIPTYLLNHDKLKIIEPVKLMLKPYYFVRYQCFSQAHVGGDDVIIESKGVAIVNAMTGTIDDLLLKEGENPSIHSKIYLQTCVDLEPKTLTTDQLLPPDLTAELIINQPNIKAIEAKSTTQIEIAKNLGIEHTYYVGSSKRSRIIYPKKSDVEILDTTFCYIPFIRVKFEIHGRTYEREVQCATINIIHDGLKTCSKCGNSSLLLCDGCGDVVCKDHNKQCATCSIPLCDNCVVKRGLLRKKYYCGSHVPVK